MDRGQVGYTDLKTAVITTISSITKRSFHPAVRHQPDQRDGYVQRVGNPLVQKSGRNCRGVTRQRDVSFQVAADNGTKFRVRTCAAENREKQNPVGDRRAEHNGSVKGGRQRSEM